ncbi:MAG: DNA-directed RNA polymerase [Polyangiaceae bacterium]|nr:DNA-directed RNA polymerase [Polyangiaceae bacterium]
MSSYPSRQPQRDPPSTAYRLLVAAALLSAAATACSAARVPLTQELRLQHGLTQGDLRNLQYYNSHTITLRREMATSGTQVTDAHKLVVRAGRLVEEVVIEAGTPGVAVDVGQDSIVVSFEQGTALAFALRGARVPDPTALLHRSGVPEPNPFPANPVAPESARQPSSPELTDLSGQFWLSTDDSTGQILFAGKWFDAVEDTLRTHLLIDAESLEHEEHDTRVLRGVRL